MASIVEELNKEAAERAALPLKTFVVRTIGKPNEGLESYQGHCLYHGTAEERVTVYRYGVGTVAVIYLQPGQVVAELETE